MDTLLTLPTIKQRVSQIVEKEPQIVAGYLFGSHAYGKPTRRSDIDLGFLCFDKQGLDVLSLSVSITKLFRSHEADVVVCDLTDRPLLLVEILKGRVIYQRSVDQRVLLERQIFKLSEDYRELARISRYYLRQSFRTGIYANKQSHH